MKLPANLLSQLRVGVAASAVLASGCDLVDAAAAAVDDGSAASAVADNGPATDPAEDAQSRSAPSTAPSERETNAANTRQDAPPRGVPATIARVVDSTRATESPRRPDPLNAAPRGETAQDDPTAFVPFTDPKSARVSTRIETPLAFAAPPTRRPKRPKVRPATPSVDEPCDPGEAAAPDKRWQCLGCGRG